MSNLGIDLDEMIDLLSRGHEVVFSLDSKEYIIQTETDDANQENLVMYQYKPTVDYLCCVPNKEDAVATVLNAKCLGEGSFMDLIGVIHVDEVF